jgi:hypothetical protein
MYQIKPYSYHKAKLLGVQIKPSKNKNKKIDVYKKGKKIATIGAIGYGDFPTFMKTHGKAYAQKKRQLYKQRHKQDRTVKNSNGYYADQLLW